jgi:periplasmic copper chaperone A
MKALTPGLIALLLAACSPHDDIDISDAYLKPPVSGRKVAVAYMTVRNRADGELLLTAAESTSASSIEFHTHVHDGDMLRMRRVDTVAVPPGETFRFEPGGYHLMVFGFNAPSGRTVAIEIQFKDHESRTVDFEVRGQAGDSQ